jgi:hypothetical protein
VVQVRLGSRQPPLCAKMIARADERANILKCHGQCVGSYSAPVSYDLYAIPVLPAEDPADAFDVLMAAEEDEATTWTDDQIARAEQLAARLQALNPRLERFVFDYPEIAKTLGVTEAEARAQRRHIELNTPDGDNPIQVAIEADHASLTVPYWYTGDRARATMREALSYLSVLAREAGWTVFDPQIERVLDLTRDLDEVVSAYEVGSRHVAELTHEPRGPQAVKPAQRKRRFWPF